MKRRYLVCYDYGQGGVWAFVSASSAQEIQEKYPELQVATERWRWMTDEWLAKIGSQPSYDLDEEPQRGLLAEILKKRQRA